MCPRRWIIKLFQSITSQWSIFWVSLKFKNEHSRAGHHPQDRSFRVGCVEFHPERDCVCSSIQSGRHWLNRHRRTDGVVEVQVVIYFDRLKVEYLWKVNYSLKTVKATIAMFQSITRELYKFWEFKKETLLPYHIQLQSYWANRGICECWFGRCKSLIRDKGSRSNHRY